MQHRASVGLSFAIAACLSLASVSLAATAPIIPGFNRLKDDGKKSPAEQGQVLLGELNCVQCHAAADVQRVLTKGAPDLSQIGSRATASYLKNYLSHPHDVKPGTSMPDLFHASDPKSRDGAVEFLVQYLVSLGGPMKPTEEEGLPAMVDAGRKLYSEVGCVACHAPDKANPTKVPSVPLPDLAKKTTIDQLAAFLLNPLKDRPASRMPNVGLTPDEAKNIAVYLLRGQLNNPKIAKDTQSKVHGVKYEYFEDHVSGAGPRGFAKLTPKSTGHLDHFMLDIPAHRADEYAVRYTATIAIPKAGRYTFYLTSDDGSRLMLDGKPVINNDGDHAAGTKDASLELTAGEHPMIVNYFQRAGDAVLKVEWAGPGIERAEIPRESLYRAGGTPMLPIDDEPITLDPQKVEMGGRMFGMLGCASCHTIPNQQSMRTAKALTALNVDSDAGCLGGHIAKGIPNYDLSDEQRIALKAAIADADGLKKPFEPKQRVIHTMAAMNCFACHVREAIGGPPSDRNELFVMTATFDMGDEGRVPPKLDRAGLKLLPDAMKQIIFDGKLHIRPVLATRMPVWSSQVLGAVVEAFQQADAEKEPAAPLFSEQAVADGRQLVGIRGGLGCINCHGMNGYKSLGMPGPDLGSIHDRIRLTWFNQWLDNPPGLVPGTRMPQFWVNHAAPLKDVAGGTEESQVGAIWTYFSVGKNAGLPSGIQSAGSELIPDMPLVHRTFMAGVGPRAILVGYPQMVHIAFDADTVRLAKAWRGKFFDAGGMWDGRGGTWNGPLGTDVIDMPDGPSFAVLDSPAAEWPKIVPTEQPPATETYRNVGGHFKGYALDKQERPTFHYVLNDVDINEQPIPVQMPTKSNLIRKFVVSAKTAPKNLYFMAASGKKIEAKSPGVWIVDDTMTITLKSPNKIEPTVRESNGTSQLLIPVNLTAGNAAFDVEMSW